MKEIVIKADRLTKKFGDFIATNAISFEVEKGEIFGFLGANGAGKTTAMRMLCGLSIPSSGEASVAGFDVYKQTEEIKQSIGYMSQKFSLYEDLTVKENIRFYAGIYGMSRAAIKEKMAALLDQLQLTAEENALVKSLPLGWKQKLAFSVAILHEPKIVFLDEPTGGVDPVTRREFWNLIYEAAAKGITVFVTTHYMDEAEHCNTIGLIYTGKLIALGSPTELKHSLDRYSVYEVLCSSPVDAMELLRGQAWTAETSIFGSAFHISTLNRSDAEKKIHGILTNEKITVSRIEKIIPSLEDVFIQRIAEEDARTNGARN